MSDEVSNSAPDPATGWKVQTRKEAWAEATRLGEWAEGVTKSFNKPNEDVEGEWLTIAQAADHLGIQERRARRWAGRLPDTDRTLDRTPAGRGRALVRLSALKTFIEAAQAAGQSPDDAPDTDQTVNAPSVGLAVAYEGVIREQAAHIVSLQAALDHERAQAQQLNQQAERLADALAREQSLRLLDTTQPKPTGFWAWLRNLSRHPMQRNDEDGVK